MTVEERIWQAIDDASYHDEECGKHVIYVDDAIMVMVKLVNEVIKEQQDYAATAARKMHSFE